MFGSITSSSSNKKEFLRTDSILRVQTKDSETEHYSWEGEHSISYLYDINFLLSTGDIIYLSYKDKQIRDNLLHDLFYENPIWIKIPEEKEDSSNDS